MEQANLGATGRKKYGVLLLHGFTSHVSCIDGIAPALQAQGIPVSIPILRGHGTKYQDMAGAKAADWFEDARKALFELLEKVDKVIVVGLSMGGLVTLDLGIHYPEKIDSVVTLAAALKFQDPLAFLSPFLSRLIKFWPSPNAYQDKESSKRNQNYPKFATRSFASLYAYALEMERKLSQLHRPICVIHSKKDTVIKPAAAQMIYDKVASTEKELVWFEKSGHEMILDLEREAVIRRVVDYIFQRMGIVG
jgi:carboxylesterase